MRRNLIRTDFQHGQLGKSRTECADKLRLHGVAQLILGVGLRHVARHVGVQLDRVGDAEGVCTVAAEGNVHVKVDARINHAESDRIGCTELVIQDLLGVEVVHPLILARVTAVGEALTDCFEGFENALAERSCENGRFGGTVPCKLTGFGTKLHDLALFNDDHALTVCDSDAGTVGDDVIFRFGIGGTSADTLLSLDDQNIVCNGVAVENSFH